MKDEIATFAAAAALAMMDTEARNITKIRKFAGNYLAIFATPPAGYRRPLYLVCTELAEELVRRYEEKKNE